MEDNFQKKTGFRQGKMEKFLNTAAATLPPQPWDANTWGTWTKGLSDTTGRKGKSLFLPLRRALTGQESGPDMPALLPLMTLHQVRDRLVGG